MKHYERMQAILTDIAIESVKLEKQENTLRERLQFTTDCVKRIETGNYSQRENDRVYDMHEKAYKAYDTFHEMYADFLVAYDSVYTAYMALKDIDI